MAAVCLHNEALKRLVHGKSVQHLPLNNYINPVSLYTNAELSRNETVLDFVRA